MFLTNLLITNPQTMLPMWADRRATLFLLIASVHRQEKARLGSPS